MVHLMLPTSYRPLIRTTRQNAHVYPMIGPGMGYKDMITGKYITSRDKTPKETETPPGYF